MADAEKTITLPKSILIPLLAAILGLGTGTAGGAGLFGIPSKNDIEALQETCKTRFDKAEATWKVQTLESKVELKELEVKQLSHEILARAKHEQQDKKLAAIAKGGTTRTR